MRRIGIFLTVLIIVAVTIAGGIYWYWQGTPRHALAQIVLAIQTQDKDSLFKYIDLPAVIGNLAAKSSEDLEIFGVPAPGANAPEDDWNRLGRNLGKKLAQYLVPKVVEVLEPQIKDKVGLYLANLGAREKVAITGLLTNASITTRQGLAEVTVKDPHSGRQFAFQMARDPATRDWRIVEVNYQDLKKYLKQFTD